MPNNSLMHYGVLGMRWGRRKGRASVSVSSDHETATALKKKHLSEMSNDELKKLTARLQLEKQYKDLSKKEVSAGQKFVTDTLQNIGKNLISDYAKRYLTVGIDKLIAQALPKPESS